MGQQTISVFARRFGLSRATLLYYDRIGLLNPAGLSSAGYRLYGEDEVNRMMRIGTFRKAGLPLLEIKKILDDGNADNLEQALENRLTALNAEIANLHVQQNLIAQLLKRDQNQARYKTVHATMWVAMLEEAGIDEAGRKRWHREFEHDAPIAHDGFLTLLGFDESAVAEIRSWSRED